MAAVAGSWFPICASFLRGNDQTIQPMAMPILLRCSLIVKWEILLMHAVELHPLLWWHHSGLPAFAQCDCCLERKMKRPDPAVGSDLATTGYFRYG